MKTTPERQTQGRIILARHGETAWSLSGQHTGTTETALTTAGELQAQALRSDLAEQSLGLVLSSPRSRARQTAVLAGFAHRAVVDPDLAEWDYGAYEGLTTLEIRSREPDWDLWHDGVPAGRTPGESAAAVRLRANRLLSRCADVVATGDNVLLIAHGHILRAIAIAWVGLPPESGSVLGLSTATLSELGLDHGRRVIRRWNCQPRA